MFAHLLQITAAGKSQRFDYGSDALNELAYNQPKPPIYDPSLISRANVSLWAGSTDAVVPASDVAKVSAQLGGESLDCSSRQISAPFIISKPIDQLSPRNHNTVPHEFHVVKGPNGGCFSHLGFLIHNQIGELVVLPSLKYLYE